MASQITNALLNGFSATQIISFLTKQFPQHSKKIKKALTSGFTAEQVLDFLNGGKGEVASGTTEHEKTRSRDIQQRENVNRQALTGATLAGGALAAPMAISALRHALPSALSGLIPNAPNTSPSPGQSPIGNVGGSPVPAPNQPQSPQAPLQPAAPQSPTTPSQQPPLSGPNLTQPVQNQQVAQVPDLKPLFEKYKGFTDKIDNLKGNTTQAIAAYFKQHNAVQTKALEKESGIPIEQIIESYLSSRPEQAENIQAQEDIGLPPTAFQPTTDLLPEPTNLVEPTEITKNSVVGTPHGMGEVKEIRNGKALVEVDGKKHQLSEDELIESPVSEKDLAELYDDLIGGIEKESGEEVSRNVNWAGYDPKTNELAYRPHNGKLYVYDDISPEDIEELTSILSQRKTSGQNFIGAWKEGSKSPIGAAMFRLIQRLQKERGGKGNEYKNRFETIYDALELGSLASKKRHAERKKRKA